MIDMKWHPQSLQIFPKMQAQVMLNAAARGTTLFGARPRRLPDFVAAEFCLK